MPEYTIIKQDNILTLRQMVNERVAQGFKPAGGIAVVVDRFDDEGELIQNPQQAKRTMYYQAMFQE